MSMNDTLLEAAQKSRYIFKNMSAPEVLEYIGTLIHLYNRIYSDKVVYEDIFTPPVSKRDNTIEITNPTTCKIPDQIAYFLEELRVV